MSIAQKQISQEDIESVQCFSKKIHCWRKELVKEYLDHLDHLDMMNEKRKTERKKKNLQENSMTCEKFDRKQMLKDGTLQKQRVAVLDKYIEEHKLPAVTETKVNQTKSVQLFLTYNRTL